MQWMQNKFAHRCEPFATACIARPCRRRYPTKRCHAHSAAARLASARIPLGDTPSAGQTPAMPYGAVLARGNFLAICCCVWRPGPRGVDDSGTDAQTRGACRTAAALPEINARCRVIRVPKAVLAAPNGPTVACSRTPRQMATAGLQRPYRCAAERHSWLMNRKKARTAGCSL